MLYPGDGVDEWNRHNQIVECSANLGCDVARSGREVFGEQHEFHDADARKQRRVLVEHDKLTGHLRITLICRAGVLLFRINRALVLASF